MEEPKICDGGAGGHGKAGWSVKGKVAIVTGAGSGMYTFLFFSSRELIYSILLCYATLWLASSA